MALNIRNPETEELAAALAALTGESKTEAVKKPTFSPFYRTSPSGSPITKRLSRQKPV